jgi:BA14K-like protein
VVTAQPLAAQNARLSYCAARYQSFDPASGTFLGDDGYRHYCW